MVTIENRLFSLKVDDNCISKSLIFKVSGEECLHPDFKMPLFSVSQERPYNNEAKLIYPNKKTTYPANSIRREGDTLTVGFDMLDIKAVIDIKETDYYIAFQLKDFIVDEDAYGVGCLPILPPPFYSFRLLQLPLKEKSRFGDWLNVSLDDFSAINLLATSLKTITDSELYSNCRILYADATRDIGFSGSGAALIVSGTEKLLDCIDVLEKDYDMPRGVESRLSENMDSSIFWTNSINPASADEYITIAKQGGFSKMLIYYSAFFKESYGYSYAGNYDFNEHYPNGIADLKNLLVKLKNSGITPGIHFLHSHIGLKSRYVTPIADHRLNLKRTFTLSQPLNEEDNVVYVEQNPEFSPVNPKFQFLKFRGEIISYDTYSTEYPYRFEGCKRGCFNTTVSSHERGTIGGILDISEFGATSVYIDERTSLQDEIAQKLAAAYNAGFEFVYFDGSEGTNAPFEYNIPLAQYRVYKLLDKKPVFCEGAAKTHFGWHMLSGGNAFDVFPTEVFKEKIAEFPLNAAAKMADNFTHVDFGWWSFDADTQPDTYEYGTSKAAACNCPATVIIKPDTLKQNSRTADVMEVMKRWEDIRKKKWLTPEQRELLKNPDNEYTLLINEDGEYELVQYFRINGAAGGNRLFSAFYFERRNRRYVVCWHTAGSGYLCLPLSDESAVYEKQLGHKSIPLQKTSDGIILPVAGRSYFSTSSEKEAVITAFEDAELFSDNIAD